MSDDPKRVSSAEKPAENQEIDEFFQRLPANFRWPKPNAEAVAAAAEALQRAAGAAVTQDVEHVNAGGSMGVTTCPVCSGSLPEGARFCVWCGSARDGSTATAANQHVHHHYHHLVPAHTGSGVAPSAEPESAGPRGRAPGSSGPAPGGRAETAARKVVLDWAQACNTRHIDDLLDLYSSDATLIRSSVPPVRSLPAIREFLLSMLEAGLGDVEMESLRMEMMGDIAMDIGRCKMLVPVAMGKRREERGKYLVVLVRQPIGTWKIIADCWSADLPMTAAPPAPEPAPRKGGEATAPGQKRR